MDLLPDTYRIVLSPFQRSIERIPSIAAALTPNGFQAMQLCLVGTQSAFGSLACSIDARNTVYPELPHLLTNVEDVRGLKANIPLVASQGLIADVLLKKQSWLSSPSAAPLIPHLENGDLVLAVNALDHDQFVYAARLLLEHGDGNVLIHTFAWLTRATPW